MGHSTEYRMIAILFLNGKPLRIADERVPVSVQDYGVAPDDWARFVTVANDALHNVQFWIGSGCCLFAAVFTMLLAAVFFLIVVGLQLPLDLPIVLVALPAILLCGTLCVRYAQILRLNRRLNAALHNGLAVTFVPHTTPSHASIQVYAHKSGTMVLATAHGSTVVPPTKGRPAVWTVLPSPKLQDERVREPPPRIPALSLDVLPRGDMYHDGDALRQGDLEDPALADLN